MRFDWLRVVRTCLGRRPLARSGLAGTPDGDASWSSVWTWTCFSALWWNHEHLLLRLSASTTQQNIVVKIFKITSSFSFTYKKLIKDLLYFRNTIHMYAPSTIFHQLGSFQNKCIKFWINSIKKNCFSNSSCKNISMRLNSTLSILKIYFSVN